VRWLVVDEVGARAAAWLHAQGRSAGPVMDPLADAGRWRAAWQRDGDLVYENLRVLPPAWLVMETRRLPPAAILAAVRTGRLPGGAAFDPQRMALIESDDALPAPDGAPPGGCAAGLQRPDDDGLVVRTTCAAAAVLVVGDVWYPGWTATVDGQPAAVRPVDYVLRGVALPAGTHTVVLRYRPLAARAGAVLALVGIVGVAAAGVWWRGRLRAAAPARG
jgi:hypothetical protein